MRAVSVATILLGLFATSVAHAEGGKGSATGSASGGATGSFRLTHQTSAAAASARARATAGDCKGALDYFDQAIRASIEPELRRDRGLCHEKLGNAFAAVDDYQAYLSNAPNAPDREAIDARMKSLAAALPKDVIHAAPTSADLQHAVGQTPDRVTLSDDGSRRTPVDQDVHSRTQTDIDYAERRDVEAFGSSVRRGIGFLVGGYYAPGYWARSGFGFTQVIGARVGYAFAGASSLLLEVGYRNNRGTGSASQSGGIQLALGYEARLALDRWSTNQILLAGFLGFEDAKQDGSGLLFRSFVPRGRIGWRHVFGPTIGLEFDADVGVAMTFAVDPPPGSQKLVVAPIVSGVVALVIGF
ncbi:hypothetical protein BH09MYX1_BH09MYX1_57450 [soil metagenome]